MNKLRQGERSFRRTYEKWEQKWGSILQEHYPDAELLKFKCRHRVYKQNGRVIKIEHSSAHTDPLQSVKNEFAIYQAVEGKAWKAHPRLRCIGNEWNVLEMDWIEGDLLADLHRLGRYDIPWLKNTLKALFILASNGVIFKQFRPQHIIRKQNGEIVFFDFGGSQLTNPSRALAQTFLPFQKTSFGRLVNSRVRGVFRLGLKSKFDTILRKNQNEDPSASITKKHSTSLVTRWNWNLSQQHLDFHGDPANFETDNIRDALVRMEDHLTKAVQADSSIIVDLFRVDLAGGEYLYQGNRHWGLIWNYVSRQLNFKGKRILDLGCSMGLASVFARIAGAEHAITVESNADMLEAARCFAEVLGVEGNEYIRMDWNDLLADSPAFLCTDVTIALSTRCATLDEELFLPLLAQSKEIIFQSLGNFDITKNRLHTLGFNHVVTLIPSPENWKVEGYKPLWAESSKEYHIIYAARR